MPESRRQALGMVLLDSPLAIDPPAITRAWKETWSKTAAPQDFSNRVDENGLSAATFTVDGLDGVYALMPVPVPGDELVGPANTTWLWPDAPSEVARVSAHFVVSVSGSATALAVHRALTRVVVSIVRAAGTSALGVYWGAASLVIKADVFVGIASDEQTPVMLWVDFRASVNEDRESSLFTIGMTELGVPEIEVPQSRKPPGEVRLFAMDLAAYLIERGPVVADGDTVGGTADERIVVRHAPSMVDRAGPVYKLEGL